MDGNFLCPEVPHHKVGYKRGADHIKVCLSQNIEEFIIRAYCTPLLLQHGPLTVVVQHMKVSINVGDPVTTVSRFSKNSRSDDNSETVQ